MHPEVEWECNHSKDIVPGFDEAGDVLDDIADGPIGRADKECGDEGVPVWEQESDREIERDENTPVSLDEQERQSEEAEFVDGEQTTPGYVEVSTPDGQIIRVSISQEDASPALHMASDNSKFGGGDKHHNKKTFSQAAAVSKVIEGGGPYGIYQDAGYHHFQSKGSVKSKAPIDGQKALDTSVIVKNKGTSILIGKKRIAIQAEGEYVVLDMTSRGNPEKGLKPIFHGHVRSWDELTTDMKEALKREGFTDNKGRIIRS
jgi:hypothetical protein